MVVIEAVDQVISAAIYYRLGIWYIAAENCTLLVLNQSNCIIISLYIVSH